MKETLTTLLRLTEADKIVDQLKNDKTDIPQIISTLKQEILLLEQKNVSKQAEHQKLAESRKLAHDFVTEKNLWLNEREEKVKDIQTNKEYQATLKEIAVAKKEIKDKELEIQNADQTLLEITQELETIQTKNAEQISEIQNRIDENQIKLEKLDLLLAEEEQKRMQIAQEITDKEALKYYEHVRHRMAPAMSRVERGACSECGHRVPPQTLNLMHSSATMQYCYRCKRILCLEEVLTSSE